MTFSTIIIIIIIMLYVLLLILSSLLRGLGADQNSTKGSVAPRQASENG